MSDWNPVLDILRGSDQVLLVAHTQPDADALGSALALGLALRQLGKRATVSFPDDPFVVPDGLAWLPGVDMVAAPAAAMDVAYDAVVSLDASSHDRIGGFLDARRPPGRLIAIDHHASFRSFADVEVVRVVSATGLLVLEVIDHLEVPLTPDIATNLYAAIASDTGSFRFRGTTAETLRIAARLMDAGVDVQEVGLRLFDTHSQAYLRLLGETLAGMQVDPAAADGAGLVWLTVTADRRAAHGLPLIAIESMVGVVRTMATADVSVVLKQDDAGRWKVSARSRGAVDVGSVCSALGGGGHRLAGGFTGTGDADETLAAFRVALQP